MSKMKPLTITIILLVLLAASAALGCTSSGESDNATPTPTPVPTPTVTPGQVVLDVKGSVNTPLSLTMADLKSIGVTHVNYTLKVHGETKYVECDAVSLNAVLNKAGIQSSATKINFYCGLDVYNKTIPLSNVTSDTRTMIGFTADTGLRNLMPNEASGIWVQNLSVITIS